jgi:hypothetical protein
MAPDGVWERANLNGWGDVDNGYADYFDKGAALFRFDLYVGTLNPSGGQVWRLPLARTVYLPLALRNLAP